VLTAALVEMEVLAAPALAAAATSLVLEDLFSPVVPEGMGWDGKEWDDKIFMASHNFRE